MLFFYLVHFLRFQLIFYIFILAYYILIYMLRLQLSFPDYPYPYSYLQNQVHLSAGIHIQKYLIDANFLFFKEIFKVI